MKQPPYLTSTACKLIIIKVETIPQGALSFCQIYSYRYARAIFGVQNFEFQYFLGVFRKNNILEYEKSVDILLGSLQNWTFLGVISIHFRTFS